MGGRSKMSSIGVVFVLGVFAQISAVVAANVTTEPSGFYKVTLAGSSDTFVSLPFVRPKAACGLVQSASGNVVTVNGSPGWTTDQFVYSAGIQPDSHYIYFRNGAKEGRYYPITANGPASLTLNLSGDTLAGVSGSDRFDIIPYWTLATIFPNGQGINISPTPGNRPTEVFIHDVNAVGIDLTASRIYYLGPGGWRQLGQGTANKNDDVLLPDAYITVRHNIAGNTTLTLRGSVLMSKWALPLATHPSSKQDNPVSLPRPVPVSLTQSGLFQSGAFNASPTPGNRTDELFTFDNTLTGIDRTASKIYYYWNGAWRRLGAGTADVGAEIVFAPATTAIIRKNLGASTPLWVNTPTY
jgi:uncharacterized protein (TIGR02597 family)